MFGDFDRAVGGEMPRAEAGFCVALFKERTLCRMGNEAALAAQVAWNPGVAFSNRYGPAPRRRRDLVGNSCGPDLLRPRRLRRAG
jgi:hypothetical protein